MQANSSTIDASLRTTCPSIMLDSNEPKAWYDRRIPRCPPLFSVRFLCFDETLVSAAAECARPCRECRRAGEAALLRALSLLLLLLLDDGHLRAARRSLESAHGLASVGLLVAHSETRRGSAHAASVARSRSDDVRVHGARHAVLHLHVQLRHDVDIVHRRILQIALSSGLNHVAHNDALNGLILQGTKAAARGGSGEANTAERRRGEAARQAATADGQRTQQTKRRRWQQSSSRRSDDGTMGGHTHDTCRHIRQPTATTSAHSLVLGARSAAEQRECCRCAADLGGAATAVSASHVLDVTATLAVLASVASLLGHLRADAATIKAMREEATEKTLGARTNREGEVSNSFHGADGICW